MKLFFSWQWQFVCTETIPECTVFQHFWSISDKAYGLGLGCQTVVSVAWVQFPDWAVSDMKIKCLKNLVTQKLSEDTKSFSELYGSFINFVISVQFNNVLSHLLELKVFYVELSNLLSAYSQKTTQMWTCLTWFPIEIDCQRAPNAQNREIKWLYENFYENCRIAKIKCREILPSKNCNILVKIKCNKVI